MTDRPLSSADERAYLVRRHDFEAAASFGFAGYGLPEHLTQKLIGTALLAFDTAAKITSRELAEGVGR